MSQLPPRRGVRVPRLVLALALGGLAAGGVYMYVGSVQQSAQQAVQQAKRDAPVPMAKVLVAKANLPAKTPLQPEQFELREVPPEAAAPFVLKSPDEVKGKVLSVPVVAGEQIPSTRLEDPKKADVKTFADLVPPGMRAMSIKFTELDGASGLMVPGDYVDVIAVFKKDVMGKDESMLLLQDVQVLAVAQSTSVDQLSTAQDEKTKSTNNGNPIAGAKPTPTPNPSAPLVPVVPPQTRTVTVAVSPEAAERLALAEDYGRLRYVIRPVGERTQHAVVPADLATVRSPLQTAQAQIVATEITPSNVKVGDTITAKITVKNVSDKPLQTQGPQPGFTYVQGQTYFSQQFASQPGKWRVAVGTAGLDSTELPFRWGLGGDLAPGASTTVTGNIKVTQDFKPTNFWAAVVEEPANVVQTGVGMTLVTSMPENVAVVAVDAANVRSGPSVASSVMDQVPYGTELEILGNSADWFKVRLPDKREGWVAAGWIVTAGR